MHAVKKKEHDKNQQHNTQDNYNGAHPGGTMSSGSGVKMVKATALSDGKVMMYMHVFFSIIQGICPHAGAAPRDVSLQELSFKKDSYQYHIISHMKIMSIPLIWHQRDLNSNIHGDT